MSSSAASAQPEVLMPDWPAPNGVRSVFTLRRGGVSASPYDSLNVGTHVGDDLAAVDENRRRVRSLLRLPAEPAWIEQVHGTNVLDLDAASAVANRALAPVAADAVVSRRTRQVCVVQVADCLPVLFAARDASVVAVAHAGWRGLAAGVLESTVNSMGVTASRLITWLGPAIGPKHFEVGEEVRAAFTDDDPGAASAFVINERDRWNCDLHALARRRLEALGINAVYGKPCCTYADHARFFSYRRDGRCGRMAALIWLEQ